MDEWMDDLFMTYFVNTKTARKVQKDLCHSNYSSRVYFVVPASFLKAFLQLIIVIYPHNVKHTSVSAAVATVIGLKHDM